MKKGIWCLFVFILLISGQANAETITDSTANRMSEANRYLSIMPPEDMFTGMAKKFSVRVPPEKRQAFIDTMTKNLDKEKFKSIIRDAMIKNFTADELKALSDFYGSGVGRSAMKKFGHYLSDAMPQLQVLMGETFQKTRAEMKN